MKVDYEANERAALRAKLVAAGVDKPLLDLLDAAGLAIVPHEPTRSMVRAFFTAPRPEGMSMTLDAGGAFVMRWKQFLKFCGFKVSPANWAERVVLSEAPAYTNIVREAGADCVLALASDGRPDERTPDNARNMRQAFFDLVELKISIESELQRPFVEWPSNLRALFGKAQQRIAETMVAAGKEPPATKKLEKLEAAAAEVMAHLDAFGPGIVSHLIDTDDNPGQRLRSLIPPAALVRAEARLKAEHPSSIASTAA